MKTVPGLPTDLGRVRMRRLALTVGFSRWAGAIALVFCFLDLPVYGPWSLLTGVLGLFALATPLVMRRAPVPEWGTHWFSFFGLLLMASNSWMRGGILSSTSAWLTAYPLIAVLALGGRSARVWVAATGVGVAALYFNTPLDDWNNDFGPAGFYTFGRVVSVWFCYRMAILFEDQAENIMARLDARRADTRLLLDNADQGFVSVDATGAMGTEASAALERWLGPRPESGRLQDWVARVDPGAAEWIELVFDSLTSGFMPFEVCADQLPRRFCADGRPLRLALRPMAGQTRFLAVVTDLTAEIGRELAEESARETATLVEMLATDRQGVRGFVDELGGLVRRLGDDLPRVEEHRVLHTIKGNAATYGITSIARYVHQVEESCLERRSGALPEEVAEIQTRWQAMLDRIAPLLPNRGRVEVQDRDLEVIEGAIAERRPHEELAWMIARLRFEPAARVLDRVSRGLPGLAARLDKEVAVDIEAADLRFPPERWGPFFTALPHVLRNAVDHGIEAPELRLEQGKPARGRLHIEAHLEGSDAVVTITDDGAGIEWERLQQVAASKGLPVATHEDLIEALFSDGISTRANSTQVSGRGIGTAAARSAIDGIGGTVRVDSTPGRGTSFVFRANLTGNDPPPLVA